MTAAPRPPHQSVWQTRASPSPAHNGLVRDRLRNAFDGAGWFLGLAVVLSFAGALWLLAVIQSTEVVLWIGRHVIGSEQGGIIFYRWQGHTYSLDVPGFGAARHVSLYVNPGDPSVAMVDSPVGRAFADLLSASPFIGALALVAAGPVRNWRQRRRKRLGRAPSGFGRGLDEDFVARRLEELRRGGGRR